MKQRDNKSTYRVAAEKIKGKVDEIAAVATGDPVLRAKAEREQIDSGAPDISATISAEARKLLGRD